MGGLGLWSCDGRERDVAGSTEEKPRQRYSVVELASRPRRARPAPFPQNTHLCYVSRHGTPLPRYALLSRLAYLSRDGGGNGRCGRGFEGGGGCGGASTAAKTSQLGHHDQASEDNLVSQTWKVEPPREGATSLPRRAQPLLLLFRSNPPTEGGGRESGTLTDSSSDLAVAPVALSAFHRYSRGGRFSRWRERDRERETKRAQWLRFTAFI